jgi:hypothetical protein
MSPDLKLGRTILLEKLRRQHARLAALDEQPRSAKRRRHRAAIVSNIRVLQRAVDAIPRTGTAPASPATPPNVAPNCGLDEWRDQLR